MDAYGMFLPEIELALFSCLLGNPSTNRALSRHSREVTGPHYATRRSEVPHPLTTKMNALVFCTNGTIISSWRIWIITITITQRPSLHFMCWLHPHLRNKSPLVLYLSARGPIPSAVGSS